MFWVYVPWQRSCGRKILLTFWPGHTEEKKKIMSSIIFRGTTLVTRAVLSASPYTLTFLPSSSIAEMGPWFLPHEHLGDNPSLNAVFWLCCLKVHICLTMQNAFSSAWNDTEVSAFPVLLKIPTLKFPLKFNANCH